MPPMMRAPQTDDCQHCTAHLCAAEQQPSASPAGPHAPPTMEQQPSNAAIKPDAPIRRLYRHAIESIFAFCSLKELHALLVVSRDWSSAVVSMPPIRALQRVQTIETLTAVASSRLARHVNHVYARCASTVEGLRILSERMPWIERYEVRWPIFQADCAEAVSALSQLRRMRTLRIVIEEPHGAPLTIETMDQSAVVANRFVEAAGCMPHLRQCWLLLTCHDERIIFAPLTALTQLRMLTVRAHCLRSPLPSEEQVAALRQMHSLESFVHEFTDRNGTLRLLLQAPTPPLRWTKALVASGDADLVAPLQRLPHLTELDVECRCGDVDFLLPLPPRVATLCLRPCGDPVGPVDLSRVVTTLQRCSQLTSLALDSLGFTCAQLSTLLPSLPLLSVLGLDRLQLTSLSFLATEALSTSLTDLTVWRCEQLPPSEVVHLLGLRSLKSLLIYELREPLSDEQRAQIRAVHPSAEL